MTTLIIHVSVITSTLSAPNDMFCLYLVILPIFTLTFLILFPNPKIL